MLTYYTTISNIAVLLFYLLLIIIVLHYPNATNTKKYYKYKGAILMAIFLTFIVYNISLLPIGIAMGAKQQNLRNIVTVPNIFLHFITPILVILDYIIFDEKGNFNYNYIPFWTLFPATYIIYEYLYIYIVNKYISIPYAYFFLDMKKIGIIGITVYLLLIWIILELCCAFFVKLDKLLSKK